MSFRGDQTMSLELRGKIGYLMWRLKRRMGNRDVLVAEIIKAYNSRPARRRTDGRIQGWTYIEVSV